MSVSDSRKRILHRVQPLLGDAVEIVLRLPQRGALSGAPSGDPASLDNDGLESRGLNVTEYPVLVEWVHDENRPPTELAEHSGSKTGVQLRYDHGRDSGTTPETTEPGHRSELSVTR
jgi:hypothetical protein